MKKIKALIVAGGLPQITLIDELKKRNIHTVLVDGSEKAIARKYADTFYCAQIFDIEAVKDIAEKEQVDFLITVCADQVLLVVAQVAEMLGLPWYINYIVCVVGNFLPVPFILLFIRAVLNWMKKVPKLDKIALWLEERAAKNSDRVSKYATWGLMLFVAIPLPGTGAWTGSLVAALLEMRLKHSLLSVFFGVLVAGVIVSLIAYGALGFLNFLL